MSGKEYAFGLLIFLFLSSFSLADGTMVCVDEREGSLYVEQKIRLDPPIEHNGKSIKFIWVRSAISAAVTPQGQNVQIVGRGIRIYYGSDPRENIIGQIQGTTRIEAIPQIPVLGTYDLQCLKDYTQKLDQKFQMFNMGQAISGFPKVKVVFSSGASNY